MSQTPKRAGGCASPATKLVANVGPVATITTLTDVTPVSQSVPVVTLTASVQERETRLNHQNGLQILFETKTVLNPETGSVSKELVRPSEAFGSTWVAFMDSTHDDYMSLDNLTFSVQGTVAFANEFGNPFGLRDSNILTGWRRMVDGREACWSVRGED